MADQRDAIAQALVDQSNTGGLSQQDFNIFSSKVSGPELQAWLAAGGVQGQYGGAVPDPDEQYFANRGLPSGSTPETSWMASLQPWQQGGQGGGETSYQSQQMIQPGFIGGGSVTRADPAYWGYRGRGQGYAPGSMGDVSGFNNNRGGGAGGTGGLTPQDFATFSRLVSPQALQDWLNAGGVQGQFGGGMGGAVGGGGQGPGGGGPNVGNANVGNANVGNTVGRGGMSMGDALNATVNATPEGWGTFGNMTGPGIGNALGGSNNNSLGGLSGGYSALGNMGTPAGYGNENGFTTDGGGLASGGFAP